MKDSISISGALLCVACCALMMRVTWAADSGSATARMRARSWPGALVYSVAAFVFFAVVLA